MASSLFRWPFSMFNEGVEHDESDGLQHLRDALEKAERQVSSSTSDSEEEQERKEEILDGLRAKLEEFEVETQKKVRITICSAVSGESIAQVRLRSTDFVVQLCEAVVKETSHKVVVAHSIIFQSEVLPQHKTISEAGLQDGDTVYVARAPVRCLTASHDGTACLWNFDQDTTNSPEAGSGQPLRLHAQGALKNASMSPGGQLLMLSTEDGGSGLLYCAETLRFLSRLQGGAQSASFSVDGQKVVGVDADGNANIWCTQTGQIMHRMFPPKASSSQLDSDSDDDSEMTFAVFSACGKFIATGSGACTQLWDASGSLQFTLSGHVGTVRHAVFSADSKYLLTASADSTARVWNCGNGRCMRVLSGHQRALTLCAFSPTGLQAITAAHDGTLKLWDLADDITDGSHTDCTLSLEADGGVVSSACFSPEGSRLLMASGSDTVRVFNASTGQMQLSFEGFHDDWVRCASFSPDGLIVATTSYDGAVGIWSATTGKCLHSLHGHTQAVVVAQLAAA
ncbi:HET-E1 [Symbiodinium sp. CCMP2456]|nr:HET-E1 [Symbiodinium sp. CCMP2456]